MQSEAIYNPWILRISDWCVEIASRAISHTRFLQSCFVFKTHVYPHHGYVVIITLLTWLCGYFHSSWEGVWLFQHWLCGYAHNICVVTMSATMGVCSPTHSLMLPKNVLLRYFCRAACKLENKSLNFSNPKFTQLCTTVEEDMRNQTCHTVFCW